MIHPIIADNLREIREYPNLIPALRLSHHFLYDVRYDAASGVDCVLMGVNPGETEPDYIQWPKEAGWSTEESSEHTFSHDMASRSARAWRTKAISMLGSKVLLAEMFLWSTPDIATLKTRFHDLEVSPILSACARWNRDLFDIYKPKLVVFTGFEFLDILARLYSVEFKSPIMATNNRGRAYRLMIPGSDGQRSWLVTKHWSSFGFSKADMCKIKATVDHHL